MMLEGLAEDFRALKAYTLPAFSATDSIDEGALVQVDMEGDVMWFMILPGGGGTDVDVDDQEVTILTPETPLGEQLIGKAKGETYRVRAGGPGGTILGVS